MTTSKIGEDAGTVWQFVHKYGPVAVPGIVKVTKLSKEQVDRAIGWLAREGKIQIKMKGDAESFTVNA